MPRYAAQLDRVAYEIRGRAHQEAARLEASGARVLKLSIGDPAQFGFRAPACIVGEVARMLETAHGYSDARGLPEARSAVARHCRAMGLIVRSEQDVYLGNGVSELITMAAHALLDVGDEVLVPAPDYPLWTAAVRLVGARAVHYPCDERADWLPDVAAIRALITRRTKALVIINPNNPTGAVYPVGVLELLLEVARQHRLVVLSDEIYDQIVYEGTHVCAAAIAPDVPCLTFNGLSKAYLLAGYRSGWLVATGPPAATAALRQNLDVLAGMRMCANVPGQCAVAAALSSPHRLSQDLVLPGGRLRDQRDALWQALTSLPGVSCVRPHGALYAFPRFDSAVWRFDNDENFVLDLLRDQHVLLVHGRAFNLADHEHARIVMLAPASALVGAVDRLQAFLNSGPACWSAGGSGRPVSPALAPHRPALAPAADRGDKLVLAPIRGYRLDASQTGDLAEVLSPPLDVLGLTEARRRALQWEGSVLNLILPDQDAGPGAASYRRASCWLRAHLARGALRPDPRHALYVYEQRGSGMHQRGLIGGLRIPAADSLTVLRHEDVDAEAVRDRFSWMREIGAQVDPILLTYEGGGAASQIVDETAEEQAPVLDVTLEGIRHRLWAVSKPGYWRAINRDLARRQAMIADGHHRYAAYQRVRMTEGPRGGLGLALLLDSARYPLTVRPIHRLFPGTPLAGLLQALPATWEVTEIGAGGTGLTPAAALRALDTVAPGRTAWVLADGRRFHMVVRSGSATSATSAISSLYGVPPGLVAGGLPWPEGTAACHPEGLLHPDVERAVAEAVSSRGTVVLNRPVSLSEVRTLAGLGVRLPQKSTFFMPKPAPALVIRLLRPT
jgi:alanine-synthesizing transaminase